MDLLRKALAIGMAARGITNFFRPFGWGSGFVVLGVLRHGWWNLVAAPLVGFFMMIYAFGLWKGDAWARPLAVAYAVWATLNVLLFPLMEALPAGVTWPRYAIFAVAGIGGPWVAVWLLRDQR